MKFPYRYAAPGMARNRMAGLDATRCRTSLIPYWKQVGFCYFRLGLVDMQLSVSVKG